MKNKQLLRILISAIFFALGFILGSFDTISFICFIISYLVIGYDILWKAIKNCFHLELFDEAFLMTIATIGAFCIGEFPEGVAVMLFFQIGEYIQDIAMNRSRKSITHLMELKVDMATVVRGGNEKNVAAEEVKIDEVIVVRPGEKIPLDGVVLEGSSNLDTMSLTGESKPLSVRENDVVLSGGINMDRLLKIKVTSTFENSTVSKILKMMEEIDQNKATTEKFITRFSKVYTPIVVILALFLAIVPSIIVGNPSEWVYRALVFLVISCPCALVLSIPLGFFCGIGKSSKYGILVKNSEAMEKISKIDTIVFDKTGTLTEGKFKVNQIRSEFLKESELLKIAAYAEYYSNHPIALSIKQVYRDEIDESQISDYQEVPGQGIKVKIGSDEVLAGNEEMLKKANLPIPEEDAIGTIVYFVINGKYVGNILISDEIKEDSYSLVEKLKQVGVQHFAVLSGDHESIVSSVCKKLGIAEYHSRLLPIDKVEYLKKLEKTSKNPVAFVGDGMNDALVLASADVGISLGGIGSDAAIEASDMVLMNDRISLIAKAIQISKKTQNIIWQNIIFAISIKVLVLILGSLGIANIWSAVFSDVGVTVLAIMNSIRILK
ncbi:MAG TPA: cadmium-translocating P-type ATPase [Candidatus Fimihabitans intestinipullorum]|uniref:Cadmium-translocating P-type ATPase n=1 Tax=Candidatus Fimihabitans intestinipullorum TaxID=2840820 RepID=A0A9D1L3G1_9BACT|nr:cadmium-translocating P-type ATPase [Candidatus Fimihabitans intestinipullorum]